MLFEKDKYLEKVDKIKKAIDEADAPTEIKKQSICIDGDINAILEDLQ